MQNINGERGKKNNPGIIRVMLCIGNIWLISSGRSESKTITR